MEYSYYPGCSLKGTAQDYEVSIQRVALKLNINLIELPDWVCCGASPTHIANEKLNLAIPAIDIKEACKYEKDLVTVCTACFNRLKTAHYILLNNQVKKKEIESLIEGNISDKIKIRHFIQVLMEDIKLEQWQTYIKKSLSGLKVACYYGCLLTRPEYMMENEKSENPEIMDNLMKILGAEPISWYYKTECCGTSFAISKTEVVVNLSNRILDAASNHKADCIVVACPLCHANLDLRQIEIDKHYNKKYNLPIFYFSELVALALGEDYKNLALDKHIIDPFSLLESKKII